LWDRRQGKGRECETEGNCDEDSDEEALSHAQKRARTLEVLPSEA
jgi:hypothetical protein